MLAGYRESLQMITGTQQPLRIDISPQVEVQYTNEITLLKPRPGNQQSSSYSVWSEEVEI